MTIREVQLKTCELWGITLDDLLSNSKIEEIYIPRQCAMVACVTVFKYRPCVVDRAFNRENGAVRNALHGKKLLLMDELKNKALLLTCEQHKKKMLSKELVS